MTELPLTSDHIDALRNGLHSEDFLLNYDKEIEGHRISARVIGERLVREGLAVELPETDSHRMFQLTDAGVARARSL